MGGLLRGERSGGNQEQTASPLEYVWVVCSAESGQAESKSNSKPIGIKPPICIPIDLQFALAVCLTTLY